MSRDRRNDLWRESRNLRQKRTVLIVTEGHRTEPYYFDGLKREVVVNSRFAVKIKPGKHSSPDAVVGEAIRLQSEEEARGSAYDEVWCVCDVENPNRAAAIRAALAEAGRNEISMVLSNPSFEVWLLAHFTWTSRSFLNAQAVIGELNKHWPGGGYRKSDSGVYDKVADRTNVGIENARAVREKDHGTDKAVIDCNSCTEVYRLVEQLTAPDVKPSG